MQFPNINNLLDFASRVLLSRGLSSFVQDIICSNNHALESTVRRLILIHKAVGLSASLHHLVTLRNLWSIHKADCGPDCSLVKGFAPFVRSASGQYTLIGIIPPGDGLVTAGIKRLLWISLAAELILVRKAHTVRLFIIRTKEVQP